MTIFSRSNGQQSSNIVGGPPMSYLTLDLLTNAGPAKAVAWLAIEPADMPWPPRPGKAVSAGPFYIVWTGEMRVRSEQWSYQLARLASQPSPTARWPELDVDPALPA